MSNLIPNNLKISFRWELIIIALIFLSALAVRIKFAWPALNGTQLFLMGDDDDYYRIAISFLNTGKLWESESASLAERMPVFPILLAVIFTVFGTAPQYGIAIIIVLSALICIGTYLLGRMVFNPLIGLAAGMIVAFDVDLILYSRFLLTEIPFVFIVLCSFIVLELFIKSPSSILAAILGLLFGLATLTRVNFSFFMPFALIYLFIYTKKIHKNINIYIGLITCIAISMWLVWVIRNYIELDAFVPFTSQGGGSYYRVYNDIPANQKDVYRFGRWSDLPIPRNILEMNELEMDRELRSIAAEWIKTHPYVALKIAFSQVFHLWAPRYYILAGLTYLIVLISSVFGLIILIRKDIFQIKLWGLLLVCLSILAFFTIADPRYSLVFHPYMAILAAFALVYINQILIRKVRELSLYAKKAFSHGNRLQ